MHISVAARVASWLLPWLAHDTPLPPASSMLTFRPIHAHAYTFYNQSSPPQLFLHNASSSVTFMSASIDSNDPDSPSPLLAAEPLAIRTKRTIIRRPKVRPPSITSWAISAQKNRIFPSSLSTSELWIAPQYEDPNGDWEDVEIDAPDVRDRQTLITLAKMASNAYVLPDGGEWWPVGDWNATVPFGWESDADGLRGHVVSHRWKRVFIRLTIDSLQTLPTRQ
jgi:lipase ATG15